jgi:16S rRNA (guanine527-N7)-methyltransferase
MSAPDLPELLRSGLRELGLKACNEQIVSLTTLATQLERWGARINLTGHRDAETIIRRLVLDAAALLAALPSFSSLADLGSGAGFPGLPMAILAPERRFILVEARERRHYFQREMVRQLGLEQVEAHRGRFDELEPICCEAVVAQAVATPSALTEHLLPWAEPSGFLVVPGGETGRLADPREDLVVRSLEYEVPLGGPARTVWLAERA